jgi:hypothetical protein
MAGTDPLLEYDYFSNVQWKPNILDYCPISNPWQQHSKYSWPTLCKATMLIIPADHDPSVGRSPVIHHHVISGGHEPGVPFAIVHPAESETRTINCSQQPAVPNRRVAGWCLAMPVKLEMFIGLCCNRPHYVQNDSYSYSIYA